MVFGNILRWESFREYSSALFFGAGVLMLAAMSLTLLRGTAWVSSPRWLHNFLGPLGVAFTAYGLVSFYPWIANASPRLARAGVVVSLLAAGSISVALTGVSVAAILTDTTITNPPGWVPILYFTTIVSLSLGFLLYGVASLRTRVPSQSVGLTMLAPAVLLFVLFVGETTLGLHVYLPRIVLIGTPGFLLFLGYTVRSGTTETDSVESPVNSPV